MQPNPCCYPERSAHALTSPRGLSQAPAILSRFLRFSIQHLAFSIFFLCLPTAHALDLLPRSTSRSRQFVVYAQSSIIRNSVGTTAEDAKASLLRALNLEDAWKLPIVIDLRYPDPGLPGARPPSQLLLAQTGAGLKIELHLLLGEEGHGTRLRDELMRAMLLEMAYRSYNGLPAGQTFNLPPPWLVEGLSAYLDNAENGVQASMFAALLPTSQTLSIQDFLSKNPATMDSISHSVYRAYSFNLIRLLLQELPNGKAELADVIHDLPGMAMDADKGAGTLREHFPELAESPDSLEKWWSVSLARLATSDQYQALSLEESEKRLAELLTFPGPSEASKGLTPKMYTINDFKEFTPLKHNKEILAAARLGLIELSGRANPLFRPIIIGYQEIVSNLIKGKTGKAEERLRDLAEQRTVVAARKSAIDDYMNWYEATQMPTTSGAFEEYFRAAKQLEATKASRRPDAISTYMDGMEAEMR